MDYIQKAGFTGIYLTPIFKATSSHKYDTIDYFIIDPEFGTNEIFEKLVKEAHQRGIRIMLDAVFNHCGYQHPFWQDVLMHGKESKYYDYFYILDADKPIFDGQVLDGVPQEIPREELNYRTFAYTPTMPKWNTGNPEVREYLLEAACFWTENIILMDGVWMSQMKFHMIFGENFEKESKIEILNCIFWAKIGIIRCHGLWGINLMQ